MTRYAKRVDENHREIVESLRLSLPEATGFDASGAGRGFPDLVVGFNGCNYLYEVKNGEKAASARKLTNAQVGFHGAWQGHAAVVCSAEEILADLARRGRRDG